MKSKILVLFMVIILAVTPILAACGETGDSNVNTVGDNEMAQENGEGENVSSVPDYDYPELNMNGRDFRILNAEPVWNFVTEIVVEEPNGEILNDTIYNRNKFIEEHFNLNMVEITADIGALETRTRTTVLAGDDAYDMIFCPRSNNAPIGSLITQGLFYNLDNIPTINLEGSWWKTSTIESSRLGQNNGIYFLQSEVAMMTLQGVWCIFFNETIMQNLGLEFPYQLVRDGKWTLEKLLEYTKAGMALNGDDSFTWNAGGSSVYGLTSPDNAMVALVTGIDEPFIKKDSNNMPFLSIENERFFSGIDKIIDITSVSGQFMEANEDRNTSTRNYERLFEIGRSFMIIAEFKSADLFRGMEDSLGIVPIPKFDEAQENYRHMLFRQCPVLVIPQTNSIPLETGIIVDALEYKSHTEVTPVYYDVSLSFKGLRNDDSIEMMHIINNSISLDLGITYDMTRQLSDDIRSALANGRIDIASLIERRKASVETNIEKTMDELEKMIMNEQ